MPISNFEHFQSYQLIPLPFENAIIIPERPILVLGTTFHQYEEAPCHQVDDIYLCRKNEDIVMDPCIIPLMRAEKANCRTVEAHLSHPILQEINDRFLLVLLSTQPLKAKINCEKKSIKIIEQNTLIKIPKGCSIHIENSTFTNIEELTKGNPLILPYIRDDLPTRKKLNNKPLVLHTINLKTIQKLENQAASLEIDEVKSSKNYWYNWIIPNLIGIILLILISTYVVKKRRNNNLHPRRDESIQENNPPVLFSLGEGGVI